ncbi:MAG: hypothetical protein ABSG07_18330 [Terriglobales bacterium]
MAARFDQTQFLACSHITILGRIVGHGIVERRNPTFFATTRSDF